MENLTRQQIFDKVKKHLLTQMERSIGEYLEVDDRPLCLYRGPNGLKCAAGCLIPDDKYQSWMEENPIDHLLSESLNYIGVGPSDYYFVFDLQKLHDNNLPDTWAVKLNEFADKYGLSP